MTTRRLNDVRKELVGKQPRGTRARELVPEFKTRRWLAIHVQEDVDFCASWQRALKQEHQLANMQLPVGTRKLRERQGVKPGQLEVEVGVPWSVAEFTAFAEKCLHPFDHEDRVDRDVAEAAQRTADLGIEATKRHREETLAYYRDAQEGP